MKLKQAHYYAIAAVIIAAAVYWYWSKNQKKTDESQGDDPKAPAPSKKQPTNKLGIVKANDYLALPLPEQIKLYDPKNLHLIKESDNSVEAYKDYCPKSDVFITNQGDFTPKLIIKNGDNYPPIFPKKGYWFRMINYGHGEEDFDAVNAYCHDDWDGFWTIELPMPDKMPQ